MKRRLLIFLVCFLILIAILIGAVWLIVPGHSITREGYDAIQFGMTESEVEAVLGVPAGDYSTYETIRVIPMEKNSNSPWGNDPARGSLAKVHMTKEWITNGVSIEVNFDSVGKVVWKTYRVSDGTERWDFLRNLLRPFRL